MGIDQGNQKLEQLAKDLRDNFCLGNKPSQGQVAVKEILSWYDYKTRGGWITKVITQNIADAGLETIPSFAGVGHHDTVLIQITEQATKDLAEFVTFPDATVRIGDLDTAKSAPITVNPNTTVTEATTIMSMNKFSQLPVVEKPHHLKGIVSWESIGKQMLSKSDREQVKDYMDKSPYAEQFDVPLLDVIEGISRNGYVIVLGKDKSVSGIVTASDIGDQFMQLAAPFQVIGEIEAHLRSLVRWRFTLKELREASLESTERTISGPADLTIGDYRNLLENPERWSRLNLNVHRTTFTNSLDEVREIRNQVMHFRARALSASEMDKLHKFVEFLPPLANIVRITA